VVVGGAELSEEVDSAREINLGLLGLTERPFDPTPEPGAHTSYPGLGRASVERPGGAENLHRKAGLAGIVEEPRLAMEQDELQAWLTQRVDLGRGRGEDLETLLRIV
jgi:hypothetical protein